jgi:predicted N-acetyltransferase YhbS
MVSKSRRISLNNYESGIKTGNRIRKFGTCPIGGYPEFQNRGIGEEMVRFGLKKAGEQGHQSAIVLGHEHYYPRFGFKRKIKVSKDDKI